MRLTFCFKFIQEVDWLAANHWQNIYPVFIQQSNFTPTQRGICHKNEYAVLARATFSDGISNSCICLTITIRKAVRPTSSTTQKVASQTFTRSRGEHAQPDLGAQTWSTMVAFHLWGNIAKACTSFLLKNAGWKKSCLANIYQKNMCIVWLLFFIYVVFVLYDYAHCTADSSSCLRQLLLCVSGCFGFRFFLLLLLRRHEIWTELAWQMSWYWFDAIVCVCICIYACMLKTFYSTLLIFECNFVDHTGVFFSFDFFVVCVFRLNTRFCLHLSVGTFLFYFILFDRWCWGNDLE